MNREGRRLWSSSSVLFLWLHGFYEVNKTGSGTKKVKVKESEEIKEKGRKGREKKRRKEEKKKKKKKV